MADWIDNADSYICPVCGFECNNPNTFHGKCPKCGFIATKDIRSADMVEVVRCKDCYHNDQCICVCCEDGEMVLCGLHHKHMDANGFCSDGWKE